MEARSSLQWLRGKNYDITMELSDMEQMALIQKKTKLKPKYLPFILAILLETQLVSFFASHSRTF